MFGSPSRSSNRNNQQLRAKQNDDMDALTGNINNLSFQNQNMYNNAFQTPIKNNVNLNNATENADYSMMDIDEDQEDLPYGHQQRKINTRNQDLTDSLESYLKIFTKRPSPKRQRE